MNMKTKRKSHREEKVGGGSYWKNGIYNWFSLFEVVNVMLGWEHSISEYRTIAPRGSTGLGSCEPSVTTFLSTSFYLMLFYVFLLKDTIVNKCWFINIELMPNQS